MDGTDLVTVSSLMGTIYASNCNQSTCSFRGLVNIITAVRDYEIKSLEGGAAA